MKFTALNRISSFVLLACTLTLVLSCKRPVDEIEVLSETPLREAYAPFFKIGAAFAVGEYGTDFRTKYASDILNEYNSITPENCMKPDQIQGVKGQFRWTYADRIVNWAKANGKVVRGHTLVWHSQSPSWMTEGGEAAARANMKTHIETILARYDETEIYAWDVLNEAISDDASGSHRTSSPWYIAYGDSSYVRDAFSFARQANPNLQLFYNDYNVATSLTKRNAIKAMIEEHNLVEDNLIDGIGFQAHWGITYPSPSEIAETIDLFADMGLKIHITELDITCNASERDLLEARYDEIFAVFREKADKIDSVTFWGIADDYTWLDNFKGFKNYPFLIDTKHERKQAYYTVRDAAL